MPSAVLVHGDIPSAALVAAVVRHPLDSPPAADNAGLVLFYTPPNVPKVPILKVEDAVANLLRDTRAGVTRLLDPPSFVHERDHFLVLSVVSALAAAEAMRSRVNIDCLFAPVWSGSVDTHVQGPTDVLQGLKSLTYALSKGRTVLKAPLASDSLTAIVAAAARRKVDFRRHAWPCGNSDTPEPCGECDWCEDRATAFRLAAVPDPWAAEGGAG